MRHDEFTGQVQSRARLAGRGDAARAACAVLETLGERVPEGLAGNLTAQLPHEIGEHLRRTEVYGGAGIGDRFGRQDFIARVAERAGAGEPQAAYLARAVAEAVQGGLVAKVAENLPENIRQLITAGSTS